ncbi:MAG: transposase [Gammaproteobacteria bacterium]|nr:transposase [Gammaproteobacteria bacterium]
MKLHVGLDHDGFLPVFMTITEGKQQDITQGRSLELDAGSIVVFDRGYTHHTSRCEHRCINNVKPISDSFSQ